MRIIEGACGGMSPRVKILGFEPLGPHVSRHAREQQSQEIECCGYYCTKQTHNLQVDQSPNEGWTSELLLYLRIQLFFYLNRCLKCTSH